MAPAQVLPFESTQPKRRLESWVGAFMAHSQSAQSNDPFRRWSAIGVLAAALERKVWIISQQRPIYPNLYIFLVGPPGIGKTAALKLGHDLFKPMTDSTDSGQHHTARVSLTKASLMDELATANRIVDKANIDFNALFIPSFELGALIPQYDPDFLNALTYLYDGILYDEKRRGNKDPLVIPNPCVTLIGCTTPSYLTSTMPVGAWDQGFLSRVIIIFSDLTEIKPLNLNEEVSSDNPQLIEDLMHDLRIIGQRYGKMTFTVRARDYINDWMNDLRTKTAPAHPRLQHYNTRRPIHLLKNCMIACADSGEPEITEENVGTALSWLTEAECTMPNIFLAMNTGGDAAVMQDCLHWALSDFMRSRVPVTPDRIHWFLSTKIPSANVQRMAEEMVRCGMMDRAPHGAGYIPRQTFRHLFDKH